MHGETFDYAIVNLEDGALVDVSMLLIFGVVAIRRLILM